MTTAIPLPEKMREAFMRFSRRMVMRFPEVFKHGRGYSVTLSISVQRQKKSRTTRRRLPLNLFGTLPTKKFSRGSKHNRTPIKSARNSSPISRSSRS